MLLIRDIMYCKPGKVRALTDKFLAMSKLNAKAGMGAFRVMTDVSAERYWTVVAEMEVASLDAFEKMMRGDDFDQCPSCARIIYYRPPGAETAESQSSSP